jgi:hypothetical protein
MKSSVLLESFSTTSTISNQSRMKRAYGSMHVCIVLPFAVCISGDQASGDNDGHMTAALPSSSN